MSEFLEKWNYYQSDIQLYLCAFLVSSLMACFYDVWSRKSIKLNNIIRICFSIIIALPVTFVIGMRHWTVGFDTYNYFKSYYQTGVLWEFDIKTLLSFTVEPGFKLLQWIAFQITDGATYGAVAPMTFFTIIAIVFAFDRLKKGITFGLILFYLLFGLNMGDQARQLLAMSIASIGFKDLFDKNKLGFSVYVIIASMFHTSALILLACVPFFDVKIRNKIQEKITVMVIVLSAFFFVIFASVFQNLIPQKYQYLFSSSVSGADIGLGLFLDLIPIILPLFLIRKQKVKIENMMIVPFIFLAIPFRFAGYITYFMMRLYYYPALLSMFYQMLNINSIFKLRKRISVKTLVILVYIGYFLVNYIYLGAHKMFPYASLDNSGMFIF